MSIYYILVNENKKEWIESGDIGLGLKEWVYEMHITQLLGFLMMGEWWAGGDGEEQYDPNKHVIELDETTTNDNFTFRGHWKGDTQIRLVSEHDQLYAMLCYDEPWSLPDDKRENWVNISIPLAKEWNYRVKYWYEDSPDMQDWIKQHVYALK